MVLDRNARGIFGGRKSLGGHSKSLGMDKAWHPKMIYKVPLLVVTAIASAMCGVWVADRDPPTYLSHTAVLTPIVQPGGDLQIQFDVTRFRNCETRVDRQIVDSAGKRAVLEPIIVINPPTPLGPQDPVVSVIPIPLTASQGKAKYQYASSWNCNPIHEWFPIKGVPNQIEFWVQGPSLPAQRVIPVP